MKRLYLIPILCATLLSGGCSKEYDDSALNGRLDGLEERVEALEELCRQMNTNISSLQTIVTALQSNDYITNVSPVKSGGKTVGYTITFAQNGAITIYHGEDGKDGKPGADGQPGTPGTPGEPGEKGEDGTTPKIGVRQDADGIYYWTLNGEWLTDDYGNKIKAQGEDGAAGKPGEDGTPGKPGNDGATGTPGKDGITPMLEIRNGYWYVSYNDGESWQQLGKATGEDGKSGAEGKPGQKGDSMFEKVEQDDEYVYITLAGETEAIAIPKKITLRIEFTEGTELQFAENETKQIHYSVIADHSDRIVVKVEMLNQDGAYTLWTEPSSASSGTITVTAANSTINRIIVTVSDGKHTIMEAIDVSKIGVVVLDVSNPGALSDLLQNYDRNLVVDLTVTGNLNESDIIDIKCLPNLQKLDLGEANIERLPDFAFFNKESLSSIVLPKTLKVIGASAFSGCSGLTGNLVIPEGVTVIEKWAFFGCKGLTGNLVIPESVKAIEEYAFSRCSGLMGDLVIPEGVTTIKEYAFHDCSGFTGNLVIPNGVTTIGQSAFSGCSGFTGDLVIPEGVTTIGRSAFLGCSGFTGNLVIPEGVTTIENNAFNGCSGFTGNLVIPESVTTIEVAVFSDCSGLTGNLAIPEDVTIIGNAAFHGCSGFTGDLVIPEGVTTIGNAAFQGCKGFTESLVIPESVTAIGGFAFAICKWKKVYCKAIIPPNLKKDSFGRYDIFSTPSEKTLYVPVGSKDAYLSAEGWKDFKFKEIIEMQF